MTTVKRYTARTIDWLAVYDRTTDRCFYVPASELGDGRIRLHLRLVPPSYRRRKDVRMASDYELLPSVEPAGLEPAASAVQGRRSTN